MVNFIVVNNSPFEIDAITVNYADEQSMQNQHANEDGVTVLSDSQIPGGTPVSTVFVQNVEVTEEATVISGAGGEELLATLIHYTDPKSGQDVIVGMEAQTESEG